MYSSCEQQAWLAAVACKNVEVKALCRWEYESALRWMRGHWIYQTAVLARNHAELIAGLQQPYSTSFAATDRD